MSFDVHRPVVVGRHGMVASAHPLATSAGLRILKDGGNAVDAAIATAATLNVVEPNMSGLAGIGWMLLTLGKTREAVALNFSGRAPAKARPELFNAQTKWEGILSPAVPANLAGWVETLRRYGTRRLDQLLGSAIQHAEEGFPLSQHNCVMIEFSREKKLSKWQSSAAIFLRGGKTPQPGELLVQKNLAATLKAIARHGADYLYRGELGKKIVRFCEKHGGLLTEEDLRDYAPQWEKHIETTYRGYTARTIAPNATAFQILETLNMLEEDNITALGHNTATYIHLLAEVGKLATADRIAYGADPDFCDIPLEQILSKAYASKRRRLVNPQKAARVEGERYNLHPTADAVRAGIPHLSGLTTHLSVVDKDRNVVSLTQTNGSIFGSGVVVEGTGVLLNNALNWFETDVDSRSPNLIAPRKRFEMPLAPIQVLKDGAPILSLGTPGSWGILQTTVQMLLNVLDFGMDIQQAISAPRFKCTEGTKLAMESRIPESMRAELQKLGHEIVLLGDYSFELGGAQGIMLDPKTGILFGGADPRRDGAAIGF